MCYNSIMKTKLSLIRQKKGKKKTDIVHCFGERSLYPTARYKAI